MRPTVPLASLGHCIEQSLREAVEQQEEHHDDRLSHSEFRKESAEHILQFVSHFAHSSLRLHILFRRRHQAAMVEPQTDEDAS